MSALNICQQCGHELLSTGECSNLICNLGNVQTKQIKIQDIISQYDNIVSKNTESSTLINVLRNATYYGSMILDKSDVTDLFSSPEYRISAGVAKYIRTVCYIVHKTTLCVLGNNRIAQALLDLIQWLDSMDSSLYANKKSGDVVHNIRFWWYEMDTLPAEYIRTKELYTMLIRVIHYNRCEKAVITNYIGAGSTEASIFEDIYYTLSSEREYYITKDLVRKIFDFFHDIVEVRYDLAYDSNPLNVLRQFSDYLSFLLCCESFTNETGQDVTHTLATAPEVTSTITTPTPKKGLLGFLRK